MWCIIIEFYSVYVKQFKRYPVIEMHLSITKYQYNNSLNNRRLLTISQRNNAEQQF